MTNKEITKYFSDTIPATWFTSVSVEADAEEILVVGTLAEGVAVDEFRASTRDERMALAEAAQELFRRQVSWGVSRGGVTTLFTHLSMPVMTRLRLRERVVLDTLIDAGVARSRSEALAWCVKLVARHEADWLGELRHALASVETVRAGGPSVA